MLLVLVWWSVVVGVIGLAVVALVSWWGSSMRVTCSWGWLVVVGLVATAGIVRLRVTTLGVALIVTLRMALRMALALTLT